MRAYLIAATADWVQKWGRALFVSVLLVALAGGSLEWTAYSLNSSNHKWCETMRLLTKHPVPRPADPQAHTAQGETWQLYTDFVTLRSELGC